MLTARNSAGIEEARAQGEPVRPLGAIERLLYRYGDRNLMHHAIVAEFPVRLAYRQVRQALAAVQARHVLLAVGIEDRPGTPLGYHRAAEAPPIPLTVVRQDDAEWHTVAEREINTPFDRSAAPLVRAVLVSGTDSAAIVLAFDHTVADGVSATLVVDDLVAALNGERIEELPPPRSQEELIAEALPAAAPPAVPGAGPGPVPGPESEPVAGDEGAPPAAAVRRPGPGERLHLHAVALREDETARLVARCRAERTTVNALIVAAACQVRGEQRGEELVRVGVPYNFRDLVGAGRSSCDYFGNSFGAVRLTGGESVWDRARAVGAALAEARSPVAVAAASALIRRLVPADATVDHAEAVLLGSPTEMAISNLGVLDLSGAGPIRPTAVWGPMMGYLPGREYLGIVTHGGCLRMTACDYASPESFLEAVRALLLTSTSSR